MRLVLRRAGSRIGVAAGEDKFGTELRDPAAADLHHDEIDLVSQDRHRPLRTGRPSGRHTASEHIVIDE
jgi:hypothetical protein